jgi:hypothetical protein
MVSWLKAQRILKFLARNPSTVRVSTENSKAFSDFSQMRYLGTRNCRF